MMTNNKTLGQIAFEAYREAKAGTTYDNKPIPAWNELGADVRAGWEAAGFAVMKQVSDVRFAHTDDPRQGKPL